MLGKLSKKVEGTSLRTTSTSSTTGTTWTAMSASKNFTNTTKLNIAKEFRNTITNKSTSRWQSFVQTRTLATHKEDPFQSLRPEPTEEENPHKAKTKEIHNQFKKFLIKVHPDRLHTYPEYKKINEESMQNMNHFIDAVNAFISKGDPEPLYTLHSPLKLSFVYQHNQQFKMLTTSFFLPMHMLTKRYEQAVPLVVGFYDNCARQLMSDLSKMEGNKKKR